MREKVYQAKVIKRLRKEFVDCLILKNDSNYIQGVPDLIVLYGPRWAMLEVKVRDTAPVQPNQEYWVAELNYMGFAAFVCPENEDEVFRDLQRAFAPNRAARSAKR